jgi:transcriptional regulator with XRE-family HTH domain
MNLDDAVATVVARMSALRGHLGRVTELAGVGRATLTKIASGKAVPRVTTLAAIDKACAQVEVEIASALGSIGGSHGVPGASRFERVHGSDGPKKAARKTVRPKTAAKSSRARKAPR